MNVSARQTNSVGDFFYNELKNTKSQTESRFIHKHEPEQWIKTDQLNHQRYIAFCLP